MRRIALLALTLSLAACRCGGGAVSSRYGELVVVQVGPTGRELLLTDATVTLPPVFMSETGTTDVAVRNVGQEQVTITAVTRLEGDPSLSLEDATGLTVAALAEGALPARFTAPQASDATTPELSQRAKFDLTLSGARPGLEHLTVELVATAVARDCYVPQVIDFGKVPLRQAVVNPLPLQNGGPLPTSTTFGALSGADPAAFSVEGTSPLEVPALGNAALRLRFSPLEERRYEARLPMQRGPACPMAEVQLVGEGSDQALTWTPTSLDFGRVPLNVTVTRTVTFSNGANVPLSLSSAFAAAGFALEPGAPTAIPARGTATVQVSCTPVVLGPASALLQLDVGTEPVTPARIPLSCIGGGPRIRVDPNPLQYGPVPFNSTGTAVTARRVLVQNVGTAPPAPGDPTNNLVLGRDGGLPWFSIIPKNARTRVEQFSVALLGTYDNTVGLPAIAGKNFAEFEVRIAPTAEGLIEADLVVYSNDQKEPSTRVPITATARAPESCNFEVTPVGFDFGSAPRSAVLVRSVMLTNNSPLNAGSCLISGIELAPGSDLAFQILDPAVSGYVIPPGASRGIRVQAVVPGDANVGDYLRGTVRFRVGTEVDRRELPVDLRVSRCLVVDPPLLDLGVVQQGCTSGSKAVTLYNVCGVPITIDSLSGVVAPFRVTSSPVGTGAFTLPQGSQVSVLVAAAPTATGNFSATMRLDTTEGGSSQVEGVGLRVTSDATGTRTDRFVQGAAEVDILLVIDDSCSMGDEQAALATNFAAFISAATAGTGDWRIGVTTTDMFSVRGQLVRTASNPAWLTRSTPNVAQLFASKVSVGIGGSGQEEPFAAMAAAVSAPNLTGSNAGFLRTNASLAVVVVTDALEQSPNSVGSYVATLRAAKGNATNRVSVSVVGPFSPLGATCQTEGSVDDGRFQSAINMTNGVKADICTGNWANDLRNVSKNVFGQLTNFKLSDTARSQNDISVTLDGQPVTSGWFYNSSENSIGFTNSPPSGTVIEVTYKTACY